MPAYVSTWGFWFAVGGAVVLVAATLLIVILLVARSIEKHATRALDAARRIEENTRPIWALAEARESLEAIRDTVEAVEEKSDLLLRTLHGAGGGARKVDR